MGKTKGLFECRMRENALSTYKDILAIEMCKIEGKKWIFLKSVWKYPWVNPWNYPDLSKMDSSTLPTLFIGKNRIKDSRFFHILKKRAFPFFGRTILGKLGKNLDWMSLRMKLTGVKPQYVMDVHQKFECSIFNGSRDITLGTSKGQTFSFNLFVSISVSFSLSVSVSLFVSFGPKEIHTQWKEEEAF